jgi:hypothetical protein
MARRLGAAIVEAGRRIEEAQSTWAGRAMPCGLIHGVDEPIGYDGIPDHFRASPAWGVDGVHEGLWIDDPGQA